MNKLTAALLLFLFVYQLKSIWARNRTKSVHIKLSLFVDTTLSKHLENNLAEIVNKHERQNLLAAYIKQVEANISGLRSAASGGLHLDLAGIRPYEPEVAPTGDIDQLLDQFCTHQALINGDAAGWRLSLLLTSLDLFSGQDAQESASLEGSRSTMGVSVIDGLNWPGLGCLIAEFGVNYDQPLSSFELARDYERLNPSRGFASAWVAAHEIGHSLGLHHDGPPFNPDCNHGGVMSSESNISSINSTWSECSVERFGQLIRTIPNDSHQPIESLTKLRELPGQMFDLHDQCKTFSRNLEYEPESLSASICDETVWCHLETNTSIGLRLIPIGPALEGTFCDVLGSRICIKRECVFLREAELVNED